ncbi:MAG: tRNA (adenosine(37)-N6)-dimethylallyltransferase MiaA [Patescibacteria group bacterium]
MAIKHIPNKKPQVLVILGTTSAGKTSLGIKLAAEFNGEIISADSRQVYKGMDIGTGKDLGEYHIGRQKIKYHLIDVVSPQTKFDLAKYQARAFKAIEDILKRGKLPIIVGGSGLYIQALVDNYQLSAGKPDLKKRALLEKLSSATLFKKIEKLKPDFAARINNSDRHNQRRLVRYLEIIMAGESEKVGRQKSPYDFLILGLDLPKEILQERILQRIIKRLEKEDMVGEVKRLHQAGLSWKRLISFGLEYKFISEYLQNKFDYEAMIDKLNRATYHFAKRQKTWFKRFEKQGAKIKWLKDLEAARKEVRAWR